MKKERIMGIIRHILTFGGGFIAAQGWATESEITSISAGVVTLIGLLWSIFAPEKKTT